MIDLKIVSLPITDKLKQKQKQAKERAKFELNKLKEEIKAFKENSENTRFRQLELIEIENKEFVIKIKNSHFQGVVLVDAIKVINEILSKFDKAKNNQLLAHTNNYNFYKQETKIKDFGYVQVGCQYIPITELKKIQRLLNKINN